MIRDDIEGRVRTFHALGRGVRHRHAHVKPIFELSVFLNGGQLIATNHEPGHEVRPIRGALERVQRTRNAHGISKVRGRGFGGEDPRNFLLRLLLSRQLLHTYRRQFTGQLMLLHNEEAASCLGRGRRIKQPKSDTIIHDRTLEVVLPARNGRFSWKIALLTPDSILAIHVKERITGGRSREYEIRVVACLSKFNDCAAIDRAIRPCFLAGTRRAGMALGSPHPVRHIL